MALPPIVTVGTGRNVTPNVTIGQAFAEEVTVASATLVITELTGDKRTLQLSGRALPYQPMDFEGEHRIEETAAAGFARTSQQPTGPGERPSTWRGMWKDRYLSDRDERFAQVDQSSSEFVEGEEVIGVDSSSLQSAAELCELVDDIRKKGQLLRVSFMHLTRVGRLSNFRQSWRTQYDVEWQAEFKWIGQDEGAALPSPSQPSLLNITQQIATAYANVESVTALDELDGLDPSVAEAIDVRVGEMNRLVAEMEGNVDARVGGALDVNDSLRRALTTITSLRDESELFIGQLEAQVSASYLLVQDPFDLTPITAGQAIAAACARLRGVRASRALKHRAARQRYATMRALDANLLAIVLCKQEQDLRVLARIYYGNPEDWQLIRRFNNLDGSVQPIGTVILIPVKQ